MIDTQRGCPSRVERADARTARGETALGIRCMGCGASQLQRRQRLSNSVAGTVDPEPAMEQSLKLRRTKPSAYDAFPASTKTAVGYDMPARPPRAGGDRCPDLPPPTDDVLHP